MLCFRSISRVCRMAPYISINDERGCSSSQHPSMHDTSNFNRQVLNCESCYAQKQFPAQSLQGSNLSGQKLPHTVVFPRHHAISCHHRSMLHVPARREQSTPAGPTINGDPRRANRAQCHEQFLVLRLQAQHAGQPWQHPRVERWRHLGVEGLHTLSIPDLVLTLCSLAEKRKSRR